MLWSTNVDRVIVLFSKLLQGIFAVLYNCVKTFLLHWYCHTLCAGSLFLSTVHSIIVSEAFVVKLCFHNLEEIRACSTLMRYTGCLTLLIKKPKVLKSKWMKRHSSIYCFAFLITSQTFQAYTYPRCELEILYSKFRLFIVSHFLCKEHRLYFLIHTFLLLMRYYFISVVPKLFLRGPPFEHKNLFVTFHIPSGQHFLVT